MHAFGIIVIAKAETMVAVQPAKILIDLFNRLSVTALQDFPDNILTIVRDNANTNYQLFKQALEFDLEQQNPGGIRTSLITNITQLWNPTVTSR